VEDSPWNSLEIVKIILAFLTPLLLLGLGIVINRAARRVEDAQWANRKLVEQRLDVYRRLALGFNDLYCFVMVLGVTPPKAIDLKRKLDKEFHINKFYSATHSLVHITDSWIAFETHVDFATDARIRVDPNTQHAEMGDALWQAECETRFSPPAERKDRNEIGRAYDSFMKCFVEELGVMPTKRKAA
jgi:hypothetical protein